MYSLELKLIWMGDTSLIEACSTAFGEIPNQRNISLRPYKITS